MATKDSISKSSVQIDGHNLYREEGYTDLKDASLRHFIPVHADGSEDGSRSHVFLGFTELPGPKGPLPIRCVIEARTLAEAIDRFPEAVETTLAKLIAAAEDKHRQEGGGN